MIERVKASLRDSWQTLGTSKNRGEGQGDNTMKLSRLGAAAQQLSVLRPAAAAVCERWGGKVSG